MAISIDMTGRVVLVTGGTKGVGRAIAQTFLDAGAAVEVCGRTQPPESPEPPHERNPQPQGSRFTSVDVRNADALDAWVSEVMSRHGRIDVVVNNAGGSPFGRFEAGSPRYYTAITELNFLSAAYLARASFTALKESEGTIINVTSISARRPSPGTAVYGAAKAALESLTKTLGAEWAPRIRVNAISCGLIATESSLSHYGGTEQIARVAATIPRGRLASPEEVASACLLLASPLAAHITGTVLNVDGGGEWPAFLEHTPNAGAFLRHETARRTP